MVPVDNNNGDNDNNETNNMNNTSAGINNTNAGINNTSGGADDVGAAVVGADDVEADDGAEEVDTANTISVNREEALRNNRPRKKKRYNRHSQYQIQELEA